MLIRGPQQCHLFPVDASLGARTLSVARESHLGKPSGRGGLGCVILRVTTLEENIRTIQILISRGIGHCISADSGGTQYGPGSKKYLQ